MIHDTNVSATFCSRSSEKNVCFSDTLFNLISLVEDQDYAISKEILHLYPFMVTNNGIFSSYLMSSQIVYADYLDVFSAF